MTDSILLRIIIEHQAELYADLMSLRTEARGDLVTEEMVDEWHYGWIQKMANEYDRLRQELGNNV